MQEEAIGGQSVAARPSNFLVITFEILGEVVVEHETDVGLVDAHAEGDGCHHDHRVFAGEPLLVLFASRVVQARMVREDGPAESPEIGGELIDLASGGAIDHPRLIPVLFKKIDCLMERIAAWLGCQEKIGPVETADELPGSIDLEKLADVLPDARGGGGRQGQAHGGGKTVSDFSQLAVFGAEIVSPLGDAVGFIHGKACQAAILEQSQGFGSEQGFGSDIEQLQLSGARTVGGGDPISVFECAIEEGGWNIDEVQLIDLVLHEGDER